VSDHESQWSNLRAELNSILECGVSIGYCRGVRQSHGCFFEQRGLYEVRGAVE
jgi:hypothetical protein